MRLQLLAASIALVLSIPATSLTAEGQQATRLPRIGYLSLNSAADPVFLRFREAFWEGMREHGYLEGQTVAIERRFAEGKPERLSGLAAELIRVKVDLIVAETTPAARAAKQATATVPIVIPDAADAVGSGLVASLARPGGNVTGLSFLGAELAGKRLGLLKEAVPQVTRVAVLWHPGLHGEGTVKVLSEETDAAARALGVRLHRVEARNPSDLVTAFREMTAEKVGALVLWPSPMFLAQRRTIVDLAAKSSLPAVYFLREFVEAGGLMSYGHDLADSFRRAAPYVDKILKGARPADLPVEQPTKFEMVINMKSAKALSLALPQSLLLRVDRVVD